MKPDVTNDKHFEPITDPNYILRKYDRMKTHGGKWHSIPHWDVGRKLKNFLQGNFFTVQKNIHAVDIDLFYDQLDTARKSFGSALKRYRKQHNMSQDRVRRFVPCCQSTIARIEQGHNSIHTCHNLLRAYHQAAEESSSKTKPHKK